MELRIENMACDGCTESVTGAIRSVDPDARIEADPAARTVKVDTLATRASLQQVLLDAGYPAAAD